MVSTGAVVEQACVFIVKPACIAEALFYRFNLGLNLAIAIIIDDIGVDVSKGTQ